MSMFIVVPRASVLSPLAQRGWRHLVLWVAKVMGAAFGDESIVLPFCRRVVRLLPASAGASACGIVVPGSGKLMVCPSSLSAADLECSSRGAAVHRCAARRQLLDHRNHLGLDHRVWLSKAADPDRRAGRRRHPEVAHAYVGAVRERLVVRDESIGLDDIGPSRAGGLEAGVEAAGSTWADVVKTNTFVTDYQAISHCSDVRMRYFGMATPTSTTIRISGLAQPAASYSTTAIISVG